MQKNGLKDRRHFHPTFLLHQLVHGVASVYKYVYLLHVKVYAIIARLCPKCPPLTVLCV
jgi:hypothetical protein